MANPTSYGSKQLFWHGHQGFEASLFPLFVDLIRDASVFFDVGANIGYYSLLASVYNPSIEVHAFEPLPAPFKYVGLNA